MAEGNGWTEYREFVLRELQRMEARMSTDFHAHRENDERLSEEINASLREINTSVRSLERDMVGLKQRAGVWGLVAGAIPAAIALVILYLEKKL